MGRTVAFAEDGNPEWLGVGRQWLRLTAEMPASAAAHAMKLESTELRTVQRWARAAQFLDSEYAAYAASVGAGSVAVLSLAKLHRLDPVAANTLAERVFSGRLTSAQISREVNSCIERSERAKMLRDRSGSVWRSTFREAALSRIVRFPQFLGRQGKLVGFEENDKRAALEADLVAFFEEPNDEVAIVVRAPRHTAAKSATTVATELMAEIGLMMLHYQDLVLVLPASAQPVCEAVIQHWKNWVRSDVRDSRRLSFSLIDGENDQVKIVQLGEA